MESVRFVHPPLFPPFELQLTEFQVVRQYVFPTHTIQFTGTTIFRVLIPVSSISHIPGLLPETQWWHGPTGHFYGSLVDDPTETSEADQKFEIAARKVVDPATDLTKKFSWGVPATKARVESFFTVFSSSNLPLPLLMRTDEGYHRITTLEFEKHFPLSRKMNGENSQPLLVPVLISLPPGVERSF